MVNRLNKSSVLTGIFAVVLTSAATLPAFAAPKPKSCRVAAIKSTKEYVAGSQFRCFRNRNAAENKNFGRFDPPAATPTPTPTPDPTGFSGLYKGDVTSFTDDCETMIPDAGLEDAGTFTYEQTVSHIGGEGILYGIDSTGRYSAGQSGTDTFTLRDRNDFTECPSGTIETADTFTVNATDTTKIDVTRSATISCPGIGTCSRTWSGQLPRP